MFWRFGGYANISTLDTFLDKPDVTIEELLDEQDLIQELKQQNSKLIDYLRDETILERLLQYVIAPKPEVAEPSPEEKEPSAEGSGGKGGSFFGRQKAKRSSLTRSEAEDEENKDKQRLNYAYVASEILSSEVWSIAEAVLENQSSLRKFWEYLKREPSLEATQAGYFAKVNESLLDKKTQETLTFFKSIDNIVPEMLKHVDCPMIMDLLLKIISLEKVEGGQGIVDWLQTQNLIPILLSFLTPEHSSATQTSAGDFLKAIITISANATTQDQSVIGPNELTRQLVSDSCVKTLITEMLRGGNPLTVGVGIVIEVIRKNNSDYDLENQTGPVPKTSDPIYLGTLLREFASHVPDFMELVQNPNHKVLNSDGTFTVRRRELKTAFGKAIEPLGFDRFKTCELMAELLHCSNMALLNERGADAEVRRRDEERERLKAEGKLPPPMDASEVNEFGTSVDSQGFHHAKPPSQLSDSPEEIRKLEVQNNADEEEFEDVAVSDVLDKTETPDADDDGMRLADSEEAKIKQHLAGVDEAAEKRPLDSPTAKATAESPISAGLSDKVGGLGLDANSTSPPAIHGKESPGSPGNQNMSLLSRQLNEASESALAADTTEQLSPHPEDKPAPLFAKKGTPTNMPSTEEEPTQNPPSDKLATSPEAPPQSSVLLTAHEGDFGPPYEVDTDGSPVVGDLLKTMFVEHKVVPTILDFFFRFPWNNFLHNVVYDVVQQVFNGNMEKGYNRCLAIDLFETGRITERIVEGQEASDKAQEETRMRLGYMGHLTLIAEEVVKFTERHPPELLDESVLDKVMHEDWVRYVEHTLTETRERDNAILGGVRPDMSVGPRQAVLNAVNASQGGFAGSGLAGGGLSNNGSIGLDGMELSNDNGMSSNYGFSGITAGMSGGSGLLSGFNNSSDEEDDDDDDEMEEGEIGSPKEEHSDQQPSIAPPPLNVGPSRARRQFVKRLAQRKRAMAEAAAGLDDSPGEEEGVEGLDMISPPIPQTGFSSTLSPDKQAELEEDEEDDLTEDEALADEDGVEIAVGRSRAGNREGRLRDLFVTGSDSDDDGEADDR